MGLSLLYHQGGASKQLQKESNERMRLWQQSLGQYRQFQNTQNVQLQGAENLYGKAVGDIESGYGSALQAAALAGRGNRRAAKDEGKQLQASTTQNQVSRGLYGTTALDNARFGVAAHTSRRLQEIADSSAQLTGQIAVGKAQALAGVRTGQAGFTANASQLRQTTMENLINLLRDKPVAYNKDLFRGAVGTQVSGEFAHWFAGRFGGSGYGSSVYQNQGQQSK